MNSSGTLLSQITEAYQEVNPLVLGAMSKYYGKPGADMLHEITEAYQGAIIARTLGHNAGFASEGENANSFSIYNAAHNAATPQTGGYQFKFYDKNGNPASQLYNTGRAEFFCNRS